MNQRPICGLCGEPLPPGEEMFKFHGHSGPCPFPPIKQKSSEPILRPGHAKVFAKDIPDDIVELVEEEVGYCSGAWDMRDPKEIIAAVINVSASYVPSQFRK